VTKNVMVQPGTGRGEIAE